MNTSQNLVGSFIQTDNVGKWLYRIFAQSCLYTLYGQNVSISKEQEDMLEDCIDNIIDEYISEQEIGIKSNKDKKEEISKYADIEKAELVKKLNKNAKDSLINYLEDKKPIVAAFKERLDVLESLQNYSDPFVAQVIKDMYENLSKVFKDTDDIEITKENLDKLQDKGVTEGFADYEKLLDLNIQIFETKINSAKTMKEQLSSVKKALYKLPNIESKI